MSDSNPYLLIHDRVDWYVLALTEHLRRQGRSLFLFGPREYESWPAVRRIGDANARSLEGDSAVLHEDFLRHYRHLSVNEQPYEQFCFERWFLIHGFATTHSPFWYIDSDYWLAPSFPTPLLPADKLWPRSKEEWLRSDPGRAMLAMVRSTPNRSLLEDS